MQQNPQPDLGVSDNYQRLSNMREQMYSVGAPATGQGSIQKNISNAPKHKADTTDYSKDDMNITQKDAPRSVIKSPRFAAFTVTDALSDSVLGRALGDKVLPSIIEDQGFLTDWKATDPSRPNLKVIGLGYVKGGFPMWDDIFHEAQGDATKLSIATQQYMAWYYNLVPKMFQQYLDADFYALRDQPQLQPTMLAVASYDWLAGRYADKYMHNYYTCLKTARDKGLQPAIEQLKTTAGWKSAQQSRRRKFIAGLQAFANYKPQTDNLS